MRTKPVLVNIMLNEGDRLCGLEVIHVPGHAPGSIALYEPARKAMFTGDTLTCRDGRVEGPPAGFTRDPQEAARSIEKLKKYDFGTMLAGHGEPLTENASEKVRQMPAPSGR